MRETESPVAIPGRIHRTNCGPGLIPAAAAIRRAESPAQPSNSWRAEMPNLDQMLDGQITWKNWPTDADLLAFLSDLQANVLKGHGRDHTANVFISFGKAAEGDVREMLTKLSYLTTSALEQLRSAEAFNATGVSGGRVVCVFLGRGAYDKLGVPDAERPANPAFREGMRARGQVDPLNFKNIPVPFAGINDPKPADWERYTTWDPKNPEPDAMVLIADDDAALVDVGVDLIKTLVEASGCTVLGVDVGLAQRRKQNGGNPKGEGIEHFGYVDGRSQPLFLTENLADEPQTRWSAAFKASQFIVGDPSNGTPFSCGSYFVYRKLEQDVAHFHDQEDQLATALGMTGDDRERAGALVVGRFEDGTPVVFDAPQAGSPINDFVYDGADDDDPAKTHCPFKAHIRKTNPRTVDDEAERGRLMARRGITYGGRRPNGKDGGFADDDRPSTGVGLLFMAYMADISEQFEFTQAAWAGNSNFQKPGTGIDAVIGQRANGPAPEITWHDPAGGKTADFDFKTSIKLVGGEYFFAPSIGALQRGLLVGQDMVAAAVA